MNTKHYLSFLLFACIILASCKKEIVELKKEEIVSTETAYNSILAKKYGADDYGMKKYVIAFLKSGPNRTDDKEKAAELQRAHMANIKRLAKEKKLVLAGPFLDNGDLRGIYIFDVASLDEARALTSSDPAIKAGSLVMELKEWYGSAALMNVSDLHDKIVKVKF